MIRTPRKALFNVYFVAYGISAVAYYLIAVGRPLTLDVSKVIPALSFALLPAFLVVVLVERYLWRLRIFRTLLSIDTPILVGRWTGNLKSNFTKNSRDHEIAVEIYQTLNSIAVWYYDVNAVTHSITAELQKPTGDGPFRLYVLYFNSPITTQYKDLHGHVGVMDLHIDRDAKSLYGTYFNNPYQRKTYGEMTLEFRQRKTLGKFVDGTDIKNRTPSVGP